MLEQFETKTQSSNRIRTYKEVLQLFTQHKNPIIFCGGRMYRPALQAQPLDDPRESLQPFFEKEGMKYYNPVDFSKEEDFEKRRDRDQLMNLIADNMGVMYYVIGTDTAMPITALELLFNWRETKIPNLTQSIVIHFLAGEEQKGMHFHLDQNHQQFSNVDEWYTKALRSANLLRTEFVEYISDLKRMLTTSEESGPGVYFAKTETEYNQLKQSPSTSSYRIPKGSLSFMTLLNAFDDVMQGKKVIVFAEEMKDGKPILTVEHTQTDEKKAFVASYIEEGNQIRNMLIRRFSSEAGVKVVFTTQQAQTAIHNLYREKKRHLDQMKDANAFAE